MMESKKIVELILNAKNIVITSHRSPDGDSIGSSVGLYRFINGLGKDAQICHPDGAPNYLRWATNNVQILNFEDDNDSVRKALNEADLIFCLDYNDPNRLGKNMAEELVKASGTKVMIDHHLNPSDFVDVAVSEPGICSTSELIYELIQSSGYIDKLNKDVATPLYLGIMTDTGSFRYGSVKPRTMHIGGELIAAGVDQAKVHEDTYDSVPISRLKLRGYASSEKIELLEGLPVAIMSLTAEELDRFSFVKGDTEGLVNVALAVEGVKMAAFFAEKDGVIKISFRSKGDLAINMLASNEFDGGGHANAAGGISHLGMEETLSKFKKVIGNYVSNSDV